MHAMVVGTHASTGACMLLGPCFACMYEPSACAFHVNNFAGIGTYIAVLPCVLYVKKLFHKQVVTLNDVRCLSWYPAGSGAGLSHAWAVSN